MSHHTLGNTLGRVFTGGLTGLETIYFTLFMAICVLYGISWIVSKKKGLIANT
jgi:hypothetical protein